MTYVSNDALNHRCGRIWNTHVANVILDGLFQYEHWARHAAKAKLFRFDFLLFGPGWGEQEIYE